MASDGKNLRLYQAVVDARKLLDELSDPETSVSGHTNASSHMEPLFSTSYASGFIFIDHTMCI